MPNYFQRQWETLNSFERPDWIRRDFLNRIKYLEIYLDVVNSFTFIECNVVSKHFLNQMSVCNQQGQPHSRVQYL